MSRFRVHVHLDAGRSPAAWDRLVERRRVWDEDPYGYRALEEFYTLTYSADVVEARAVALARRIARRTLGLDVIHAWRNRSAMQNSDCIVTHTENEFLAVLLLLRLMRNDRAHVICQAVWLWDRWPRLSWARRKWYLALMTRAAALTVLSPENLAVARETVRGIPVIFVPYGIRPLQPLAARPPADGVTRIVSAGNDRDRDWTVLAAAVERVAGAEMRVRTRSASARRAFAGRPTSVRPSVSVDEFWSDLAWCDVVVVPLRDNLHASGVTVVLEAVSAGRPVVVADVGGLHAYFGDRVNYYRAGDHSSLVDAIGRAVAAGPLARPGGGPGSFVEERGLRSVDYAYRHVLLIEALNRGAEVSQAVSSLAPPLLDRVEQ